MARGINLQLLADVRDFLRGTSSAQDALEDVAGALDDVVADSAHAQEAMSADFAKIASDANTSADKVSTAYKGAGDSAVDSTGRAREGIRGAGDELKAEGLAGAAAFDGSMSSAADSAQAFSSVALAAFGPIGVGLGVVAAAGFGAWRAAQQKAKEATEAWVNAVIQGNGKVADSFVETDLQAKAADGTLAKLAESAKTLGLSFDTVVRAAYGDAGALAEVTKQHEQLRGEQGLAILHAGGLTQAMIDQNAAFDELRKVMGPAIDGQTKGARAADLNAAALKAMGIATEDATEATTADTDALTDHTQALLDARGMARDYEQALDDATQALKDNGATLDIHTQKGRDNQRALDAVAEAARADGDIRRDERQHYLDLAEAMGMSERAAKRLADQLGLIPTTTTAKVTVDLNANPETQRALNRLGFRWDQT